MQERSLYRGGYGGSFLDDHIALKWVSLRRSLPIALCHRQGGFAQPDAVPDDPIHVIALYY